MSPDDMSPDEQKRIAGLLVAGGDHENQARELLASLGVDDIHEWLAGYYLDLIFQTVFNFEALYGRKPGAVFVNYNDWMHARSSLGPAPDPLTGHTKAFGVDVLRCMDLPRHVVVPVRTIPL